MKVKQTPVQSQILKNPESRRSFTEA
ncbi:MAG: hypothetical protein JWL59_4918, partial [Chthoniobacteraceae bacterium]|nr:hypothetical protein [Chthoniobacteraceae bacterium]MDB6175607.1 hypothetical protein [Chthoniobacteraceae bacterium]